MQDTISAISKRVASAGYPFVRVTPRGNRDMSGKTIAVDYLVDQGEKAYVERIEIRGNTSTRDYVIRREFDIAEGDAFNQEMLAEAKRRLDALGYFSSVAISTAPGSAADRVVVIVDVMTSRPAISASAAAMRPAAKASSWKPRSRKRTSSAAASTSACRLRAAC